MTGATVAVLGLVATWLAAPDPARRLRSVAAGRLTASSLAAAAGDVALLADLVAAALGAGATPVSALDVAGRAVGGAEGDEVVTVAARLRLGSDWGAAWVGTSAAVVPLQRSLRLALGTGAPGADLVRATATELRRRRHRAAQLEANRLGVRLVLPLGLCALPAFGLLGVVPVVVSLAGQVLAGA